MAFKAEHPGTTVALTARPDFCSAAAALGTPGPISKASAHAHAAMGRSLLWLLLGCTESSTQEVSDSASGSDRAESGRKGYVNFLTYSNRRSRLRNTSPTYTSNAIEAIKGQSFV